VLQALWQEDGLSAGELAQRLGGEPGTVTRAVRRMASAGLLERRPDKRDRRRVRMGEEADDLVAARRVPIGLTQLSSAEAG
jgi:DNA-binding MarR family transcriptional regulator